MQFDLYLTIVWFPIPTCDFGWAWWSLMYAFSVENKWPVPVLILTCRDHLSFYLFFFLYCLRFNCIWKKKLFSINWALAQWLHTCWRYTAPILCILQSNMLIVKCGEQLDSLSRNINSLYPISSYYMYVLKLQEMNITLL